MKIISNKKWLTVLSAAALLLPLSATAETYKPAYFDFTAEQLVAKIDAASITKAATLYCQAEVDVNGAPDRVKCYDKASNTDLVMQAQQALIALTFTAAEVDSQKVPVRMNFRVALNVSNHGPVAALIPNLGSMQAQYGRDYIAPQERLDVSDWYQRYSDNSSVNGGVFLDDAPLSRVAATIEEDGRPTIVRTMDADRAYKRDATVVQSALKRSRFIPGFIDDKPVPMGYLAVVNYGGTGQAVSSR